MLLVNPLLLLRFPLFFLGPNTVWMAYRLTSVRGKVTSTGPNMGTSANDGFLSRSNIDGSNLVLDTEREYFYWCNREGGKIQRCKLDSSHIQMFYISASTPEEHKDQRTWCVGIAVDPAHGLLYWMQKGNSKGSNGRIFRANIDPPASADPTRCTNVQILFEGLPEPIDLEYHDGFLY
ncbi:hypothetical protein B0H14DRAFT_3553266 [Mycena olivaceomarginata]|nr:hypothetical protein B0H14DRAFT_3553266 [Mycena olivaceomarginata]